MKLVFTSYISSPEFHEPVSWLKRIEAYTGILEALAEEHEVIGIERINYQGKYEENGVKYEFVKLSPGKNLFPRSLHQHIKGLNPDVVFINGFVFPLQIIQLRLKLGSRIKIFVLHRAERPFSGLKRIVQKIADRCINGCCFASRESAAEWPEQGIISNRKKIFEIMQASSRFRFKERKEHDTIHYLWVGRMDHNKDPLTVLKAFIPFLEQHNVILEMIHPSKELLPEVRQLIETSTVAKNKIRLAGFVDHDQMGEWYNRADYIVSTSHYEGSGVAVCEAMSCGCIPVLTNIPSFRKMTDKGRIGFLFEAGDHKQLAEILDKTVSMDVQEERKKVLDQFDRELSFSAIAKKILHMIQSV